MQRHSRIPIEMGTCLSMTFIRSNESRNRGFCDNKKAVQSAICICRFHIHRFSQSWISKYSGGKKIQKVPKKQNLNLPHISNHLHGIYIVLEIAIDLDSILYYIILHKELEHPQILIPKESPGTNPPQLPKGTTSYA